MRHLSSIVWYWCLSSDFFLRVAWAHIKRNNYTVNLKSWYFQCVLTPRRCFALRTFANKGKCLLWRMESRGTPADECTYWTKSGKKLGLIVRTISQYSSNYAVFIVEWRVKGLTCNELNLEVYCIPFNQSARRWVTALHINSNPISNGTVSWIQISSAPIWIKKVRRPSNWLTHGIPEREWRKPMQGLQKRQGRPSYCLLEAFCGIEWISDTKVAPYI